MAELGNSDKLISKLREVARETLGKSSDGVCLTTVSIYLDRRGEPLLWYVEKACRLEPSPDAKPVLQRIFTNSITLDKE